MVTVKFWRSVHALLDDGRRMLAALPVTRGFVHMLHPYVKIICRMSIIAATCVTHTEHKATSFCLQQYLKVYSSDFFKAQYVTLHALIYKTFSNTAIYVIYHMIWDAFGASVLSYFTFIIASYTLVFFF